MKKSVLIKSIGYACGVVLFFPHMVFAQEITDLEDAVATIFNSIAPLFVGLAVVFFLWQLLKFTRLAEGDKERDEAKGLMVYGIIAILVMVSIWGIIAVLTHMLDLQNDRSITNFEEIVPERP